jgi:hypothetical protein
MNDPAMQQGIELAHRIALAVLSLGLVGVVLELVRRDLLKERYALLWLVASGAGLIVGVFPGSIEFLSQLFRFQYLTLLFALSFAFTLGMVLVFSVIISRLTEHNRALTQEVALLANTVKQLKERRDDE